MHKPTFRVALLISCVSVLIIRYKLWRFQTLLLRCLCVSTAVTVVDGGCRGPGVVE